MKPIASRRPVRRTTARESRGTALFALLVALPLAISPQAARSTPSDEASVRAHVTCFRVAATEVLLAAPQPGDTLALPQKLIAGESFTAWQDSVRLVAGRDYLLDETRGRLIWLRDAAPGKAPLRVTYRYFPFDVAGHWGIALHEPAPGETLIAPHAVSSADQELPPGARLTLGGSKTFTIDFGNRRDLKLSQSLDLTIRGQLAEQVKVNAVLTDRNLPLQPEGTTAKLSDLDKVLIEVESPWADLRLGDLAVEHRTYSFVAHRRELTGLNLRAGRRTSAHGSGALGTGVGRNVTIEFFGEHGKQGPYRVVTPQPGEDVLMVAGSERVWLDNVRLQRGEDADYTVDYSAGEIWFTSRHPMTSRSEVRAQFQVRHGAYERGYYWLSTAAGDTARSVGLAWLRERDDPWNSPTLALTEEEREALAAAGDSVTEALEGGVTWVGEGHGPYALVDSDTLSTSIFLYVGRDEEGEYRGSYEVIFSDVGDGQGDYRDSTLTSSEVVYIYEGEKLARFLPGRRLPLPESHDVLTLRAAGGVGGGLSLLAEGAVSWHDRNILSTLDDGDNDGSAARLEGSWRLAELLGHPGNAVELRFRYRNVHERFSQVEPLDPAFYARRWNTTPEVLDGRDQRGAVGLRVRPGRGLRLDTEWERLDAVNDFSGERWHARAERQGRLRALAEFWSGRSELNGVPGSQTRYITRLGWHGRTLLEAGYDGEDLRRGPSAAANGTGHRTGLVKIGTGELLPWLAATGRASVRWDHVVEEGSERQARRLDVYQIEGEAAGRRGLAHLLYVRTASHAEGSALSARSDLADWTFRLEGDRRLKVEWRGKVSQEETALRTERLVYAGPEGGQYDSLGHYVGIGDYALFFTAGDTLQLATRVETALRLSTRPFANSAATAGTWAGIEASFYGKVGASSPLSLGHLVSNPAGIFRGAEPTQDQSSVVRPELSWRAPVGWPAPKLQFEERRTTQRSATGFTRTGRTSLQDLETNWRMRPPLHGRLQLMRQKDGSGVREPTSGDISYDERTTLSAVGEVRWRFREPFSARFMGEAGRTTFDPSDATRRTYEATVGTVADLKRLGRAEITYEHRWVTQQGSPSGGFVLLEPGWRLTVSGSLRPRPGITTSLWVRVEQPEGRRQLISGRMELRAFF